MSREFNRMHNEYLNPQGHYDMEESAAIGQVIAACAKAIFEAHDCETMAQLQRNMYKYTTAGIAISFELHESAPGLPCVFVGDPRANEIKEPWNWVRKIGVSSIVEGSDAEVPLTWIDLIRYCDDDKYEGDLDDLAKIAVKDFDELCETVDNEASTMWEDAHTDEALVVKPFYDPERL